MQVTIRSKFEGEEPRTVEAEAVPGTEELFAVHPTTYPQTEDLFEKDAEEDPPRDWTITHVPSEFGVIHQLPAREIAIDVASQLFRSYPALWFHCDPIQIVAKTPKAMQQWIMNLRAIAALNQVSPVPLAMIRTLAEYEAFKKSQKKERS
jgi:hypothetical protein